MRRSASSLNLTALALAGVLGALAVPTLAQGSPSSPRHRSPVACKAAKKARKAPRKAPRKVIRCAAVRVLRHGAVRADQLKAPAPRPGRHPAFSPTKPVPAPVATAAALAPIAAPSPSPSPQSRVPAGPRYWGAWIGSHLTGIEAPWDKGAMDAFEQHAGKRMSLVNFSNPFANCFTSPCKPYTFPTGEFNTIRGRGSIPFFSWANDALPLSGDQSAYQLSDVIAGRHDSYITAWATAARKWGHPFFLRFNWEMNGSWFPWSEGANGNKAGEYVAAWRHVHDLFTSAGATNTTWVWCPSTDPGHYMQSLDGLYPGDGYVDWTCLDGYNFDKPRTSFQDLFKTTYDEITGRIAPSKPMIIGETGSTEAGGSKAAWITDMFASLETSFPAIRGLLWFNKFDDGMDWPIETSSSATAAFKAGIASPRFKANSYAQLDGLKAVAAPPS